MWRRQKDTAKSSRLRLTCKKSSDSKTPDSVSSYFVRTAQVQGSEASQNAQSNEVISEPPYQNISAEIIDPLLNDSLREKDDFKCAAPTRRAPKPEAKPSCARTQKPKKPRQITMTRLMEKQFRNVDTNAEHLQLAVALSRSLQDSKEEEEEETQERTGRAGGNTILEQFGFRSCSESKITTGDPFKKQKKKSRYQYVTPVLSLRTEEDRERIIATKTSLVLSQRRAPKIDGGDAAATSPPRLHSVHLQKLKRDEGGAYKLNRLTRAQLQDKTLFHLSELKAVPPGTCPVGYLLKDWGAIFGRGTTPPPPPTSTDDREELKETRSSQHQELESGAPSRGQENIEKGATQNCTSPNLFDSDDDDDYKCVADGLNKSIEEQLHLSQRLIDCFKAKRASTNGETHDGGFNSSGSDSDRSDIWCFESYRDDCFGLITEGDGVFDVEGNVGGSRDVQVEGTNLFDLTVSSSSDGESHVGEGPELGRKWETVSTGSGTDSSDCELEMCGGEKKVKNNSFDEDVEPSQELEIYNCWAESSENRTEKSRPRENNSPTSESGGEIIRIEDDGPPGVVYGALISKTDGDLSYGDEEINLCEKTNHHLLSEGRALKKINSSGSISDGDLSVSDEELNYSSLRAKFVELEDPVRPKLNGVKTPKSSAFIPNGDPPKNFDAVKNLADVNERTPENRGDDDLIVKVGVDVTPMPNYAEMDTPGIAGELRGFGIKNLKRRRGVEMLRYIYDSTHPLVPRGEGGDNPVKKPRRILAEENPQRIELVGESLQENENDLIFERKQSVKISSCRVPLHIAWRNLVASHPEIRKNILLYEPIQLEVLHLLLKEQGYRYSVQDLLTFLDRKCITVRTNQNPRKADFHRIKTKRSTALSSS